MADKTSIKTELDLISALEGGEVVSQAALSTRLSVSVGMVNALLKRVIRKGLVKTRTAPYRRWAYYVTPAGFSEKGRLVARYLEVSLDFFRQARQEYAEIFLALRRAGIGRVVLVGRGELAEIAFLAARENEIEILGLLDVEMNDDRFLGLPVLRCLDGLDGAALVVTASRRPQQAFDDLRRHASASMIHAPSLLRISSDAPANPAHHAKEAAEAAP